MLLYVLLQGCSLFLEEPFDVYVYKGAMMYKDLDKDIQ